MADHGLDGFLYEQSVDGSGATFDFTDPEDVENTAHVTVDKKDFPEGAQAGSREVADIAYAQVNKQLNDKRDARIAKTEQDRVQKELDRDAAERAANADFYDVSNENTVEPVTTEKREDGVTQNVYNTAVLNDQADQNSGKKKK